MKYQNGKEECSSFKTLKGRRKGTFLLNTSDILIVTKLKYDVFCPHSTRPTRRRTSSFAKGRYTIPFLSVHLRDRVNEYISNTSKTLISM